MREAAAARIALAQSLAAQAPDTNNDSELTTLLAVQALNLAGESWARPDG